MLLRRVKIYSISIWIFEKIVLPFGSSPVFGRPILPVFGKQGTLGLLEHLILPVFGKPGELVAAVPPTSTAVPYEPIAQLSVAATSIQID